MIAAWRQLNSAQRLGAFAMVLILSMMIANQWLSVSLLGNSLSDVADSWTEADTLRAGEGYARLGFGANAGLPDLCFGNQFPTVGTKLMLRDQRTQHQYWEKGALATRLGKEEIDGDRFVYTHYPPGPHWIAGLLTRTFGVGQVQLFRIVPVTIGLLAVFYLAAELLLRIGPLRTAAALAVFACVPMFGNMMHGLSYQGYALALLLLQIGLSLRVQRYGGTSVWILGSLFILGFLQGWLGFDYLFLIALSPVAVWLADANDQVSWRTILAMCLTVVCGFVAANLLHFIQVAVYFGSTHEALDDLATAAQYRSNGATSDTGQATPGRMTIVLKYLFLYTSDPLQLGMSIMPIAAAGIVLLIIGKRLWPAQVLPRHILAIPLAVAVASMWVVLMPQHAANHGHFIPRHYFLPLFIVVYSCLARLPATARPPTKGVLGDDYAGSRILG